MIWRRCSSSSHRGSLDETTASTRANGNRRRPNFRERAPCRYFGENEPLWGALACALILREDGLPQAWGSHAGCGDEGQGWREAAPADHGVEPLIGASPPAPWDLSEVGRVGV